MTQRTVKRRRGPPERRRTTDALPQVSVQRDQSGKFVPTPEAFTVTSSLRSNLEMHLENMRDGREGRTPKYPYVERLIEIFLQSLVDHKEATITVRLDPLKRRGERRDLSLEQAMCLEFLRLTELNGIKSARAKGAIADAFSEKTGRAIEIRQVERAVERQRTKVLPFLKHYERRLRIRKQLR